MGKIIQNGIEYSGTYSNATSINYDSSASGLNAKTVQEAVDEVHESLSVKKITCELTTDGWGLASWEQFVPKNSTTLRVNASIPTGHDSICDVINNFGYFYCSPDKDSALTRVKNTTLSATVYYI